MFEPSFTITPDMAKTLMEIEASRQAIDALPIDIHVLASLRQSARLASTHYSTRIEGNRLTQEQVAEALTGAHFPGRERDEAEVRNYYRALERIEALATRPGLVNELDLKRIHGIVLLGRSHDSGYRDGQNVIRDSATGGIVYLPPEAADVPGLMAELFRWVNVELDHMELPAPLIGAIAHYQYATIHPYYDGNGRTARLLTTLVLHKAGYGLKGIYSLDEHYARDLGTYYAALTVGPSHNYYLGRAEADVTGFIEYFCRSMAAAFDAVRVHTSSASALGRRDDSPRLRAIDLRQRRVLELFRDRAVASTLEIAGYLRLSPRTVALLCNKWVTSGFLEVADPSRRARSYRLAPEYERLVGGGG